MALKLHHVGYVVRDINESADKYKKIFGEVAESPMYLDPNQDVRVKFIRANPGDQAAIEFIEPLSEHSPVSNFLTKYGGGLNHICYEVKDLGKKITMLQYNGAILVRSPRAAAAFNQRKVAFLYILGGLLVELLEEGADGNGQ